MGHCGQAKYRGQPNLINQVVATPQGGVRVAPTFHKSGVDTMKINEENFEEMLGHLTGETILKMIDDLETSFHLDWFSEETKPSFHLANILEYLKDYYTKYHSL